MIDWARTLPDDSFEIKPIVITTVDNSAKTQAPQTLSMDLSVSEFELVEQI